MGMYSLKSVESRWREIWRVLQVVLLWLVLIISWYFLVQKQLFYSRALLIYSAVLLAAMLCFGRMLIAIIQHLLHLRGVGVRTIVTLGKNDPADAALDNLMNDKRYRYQGHFKTLENVLSQFNNHSLDLIIQTDPDPSSESTMAILEYCRSQHVGYGFLPPILADVPQQLEIQHLGLVPLMKFTPTPLDGWGRVYKRMADIIGSLLLLILLSPVLLLVSLGVLLTSGWPIFYVSKRVTGKGDATIPLLKFRSMVTNADSIKATLQEKNERDGPLFKIDNDPRVTHFGHLIRRFDIDELPQLFNVLCGHLSLVGPRPHLPSEVNEYSNFHKRVFAVKPGITGLAQVSGRSDLAFDDEVSLDLRYIEEWSPLMDVWILWRTIGVVLRK
jgi:exopolysaccharide biosynthesis polyprenyl glycosylphosphotransferase